MDDGIRVVHVDADPDLLDRTASFIERALEGVTVLTASNAEQGDELLDEEDVDCVVCGYDIPGRPGLEFLEYVYEEHSDVPVILFTGEGIGSEDVSGRVTDHLYTDERESYERLADRIENAVGGRPSRGTERARQVGTLSDLPETNTILSTLLENLPVGILAEVDAHEIIAANPGFCRIFDIPTAPEEIVGQHPHRFAESSKELFADPEGFIRRIEEIMERREPVREEEYELANGRVVEQSCVPFSLPAGDANMWLFQDVTERREHERKLRERTQQLQGLLDTISASIFMKDTDGRYILMNRNAKELLGVDVDQEVAGWTPYDIFPEEAAARFNSDDQRVFEAEETIELVEKVPTPHGMTTHLTRKSPIFDETGEPYAVCAVATDITDHQERERELRRQNERLKKFSSVISHDLRNPLNVAHGRLEFLRDDCDSETIDTIADALERMEAIIEGTLTLASQGRTIGETASIDVAELGGRSWETVSSGRATLEIVDAPTIRGDPDRIRQVFENLFRNAVEHGGPDVTVRVGSFDGDGVYVEDDGPGIPKGLRADVFEPGHSSTEGGTGFGLAIVDEIVEAHGWHVTAGESDAGGARFEITGVDVV